MPMSSVSSNNLADIYGRRPTIQSPAALGSTALNVLNQAIPGFSGLTQSATDIIRNRMAGNLSPETQSAIQRAGATQAVASGMPGSAGISGTLMGNRVLRDIGATTEGYQQQGFNDLLSLLGGYSGTATPTVGQLQEQANVGAELAAAPDPAAAGQYAEELYQKRFDEAQRLAGGGSSESDLPWWVDPGNPYRTRRPGDYGFGFSTTPMYIGPALQAG